MNGKDVGTGFLVVELDNTVSIKTLFKTQFLFMLGDVKEAVQGNRKSKSPQAAEMSLSYGPSQTT